MPLDFAWLPRGGGLTEADWEARHRLLTRILAVHVPLIIGYALVSGHTFDEGLLVTVPIAVLLGLASLSGPRLRRSLATSLGLLSCSAALVDLSDGFPEMHFHYFVAVALIALYQEWLVYAVAIGFVLIEHGVLGAIFPHSVYNRDGNPWVLAAVHAGFLCAVAAAQLVFWHYQERTRASEEHYRRELYEGQNSLVSQLEETARVRSDLVATVTHEFRTPLTGISGALLTLRRRRHRLDDAQVDDLLDAAVLHTDRLRRLLENMLIAAQATAVDPSAVSDLAAEIRAAVQVLPHAARDRVELDLPESLPAYLDRSALHQVLSNLLDNAFVHSWPGTPVHVSGGRVGGDAVLRIRNSGPDLDPEVVGRLLEPFTQVDGSATRASEGVGLGLYVVRRLVEVHGGQLSLQSADGQVTVEIDLRAAVAPASPAGLEQSIAAQREPRRDPEEPTSV